MSAFGYTRAAVHRALADGLTIPEIAAKLGVTRAAVDYQLAVLRQNGLAAPGPWRSLVSPDEAPTVRRRRTVAKVLAEALEPLTLSEVSERAGITRDAAHYRLYALLSEGAVRKAGRARATVWTLRRAA
jgi:predicted ArsR family transcriptional regulator